MQRCAAVLSLSAWLIVGCGAAANARTPRDTLRRSRSQSEPRTGEPGVSPGAATATQERSTGARETPIEDLTARYGGRRAIVTFHGPVSYYHDSLAGNRTANGELYDPRAYTAASRALPFGTIVRVVQSDSGRAVVVRINDRGPFGRRGRVLDLSRAAAEALDMIRRGVVSARCEVLEYGQ